MLKNNKLFMCSAILKNHYGDYDYVSNAHIVEMEAGEEVCMKTTGGAHSAL